MTTTQKILKYGIWAGLFIIPFIPFIVPSTMFFPFITGKGFTFRIVVEIIFGLFVALAMLEPVYRPKMSWITKSVLLFTFAVLIADLFGVNPAKSLWSNYERMEGFVLIAHIFLYYIVLSSVLNTKELWNRYINLILFGGVLTSIYGLFQVFGFITINQGGVRVDATFGNAAYFAIYLVFNIFLCLYMMLDSMVPAWQKRLYGVVVVLELIILYYTATRGAILGLIGGVIFTALLVLWKEKENKSLIKISIYTLGTLAVFILAFFMVRNAKFVNENQVLSRFSTLSPSEFKTQGRSFVWPMALKGISEKPILGWGQENFNFVFNKNYDPGMFGQEEWFDRTHNVFLDWLIAGGLLGFVSYSLMYLALLYYVWRKESMLSVSQKSVLTGLIVAYVFHNIFVFDNLISYIMFFTILAFVHFLSNQNQVGGGFYSKTFGTEAVNYVVFPIIAIFIIGTIYYVNVPAFLANKTLIRAMSPQSGGIDENLKLFKKVFEYNSFGNSEAVEQLVTAASQVIASQSGVTDAQKQAFYELATTKLKEKISQIPNDARYLVFAGSFYNRVGQYDEAIKYLDEALVQSPKKQTIIFELGTSYLGKGDTKKTLELFKKAYELKPESRESMTLYALAAIYAKDGDTLEKLSGSLNSEVILNDNRFISAYRSVGDYNSIINILKVRLQRDPKNRDTRLTLASVYSEIGQKQQAINIIKDIIKEDPSFKDQGDEYIRQIQG